MGCLWNRSRRKKKENKYPAAAIPRSRGDYYSSTQDYEGGAAKGSHVGGSRDGGLVFMTDNGAAVAAAATFSATAAVSVDGGGGGGGCGGGG